MLAPAPGTRSYTKAIVAAQMLAQIGAFALPALLPGYIARWDLVRRGALEQWYDFSNKSEETALREWCVKNGIHAVAISWWP